MKTTFGRTFFTVLLVLLLSLLIVGIFLRALLFGYLEDNTFRKLENESKRIAQLAGAYYADGAMSGMDFITNLDVMTESSQTDAVICNMQGNILLCSDELMKCKHIGLTVGEDFAKKVASDGMVTDTGMIRGLYDDPRYLCATPIVHQGRAMGIVLVSTSTASSFVILQKMTELYAILSVLVVLCSVLAVSIFIKRQSKPLRQMAKTARQFGHGNLDARVDTQDSYTQEVEELALAFNNMAASLQKSEYQRQEFVANVSHELKTPMTTISGYVDGVLDGTIPPEKSRQYLQLVSDETKRLNRLVRSMLDISQLQNETIPEEKRSRFDLSETVGRVLITFEHKIMSKNVQVEVQMPEHPVYTHANQDYITQVVYNLLDNAVKFCPEGGEIGVRMQEARGKVYVSVYNDGQTIPPEELPLVFDRFHKIDKSRSENRDGWGLGLYIVKTIVCSHGENISVTSRDGRTEFTFTMPLVI